MKQIGEIVDDLLSKEQELVEKVKLLKEAEIELSKVQAALKAFNISSNNHVIKHTPASYNTKATWKEKIKYTAVLRPDSGIKDISDYIHEMEPSLNYQTIYNSVAVNVGEMVKKKDLIAKEGNGRKVYAYIGK